MLSTCRLPNVEKMGDGAGNPIRYFLCTNYVMAHTGQPPKWGHCTQRCKQSFPFLSKTNGEKSNISRIQVSDMQSQFPYS